MRYFLVYVIIIGLSANIRAQVILSQNRKASKVYEQGRKLQSERDFAGAINKYNVAIRHDSSFAEAYRQAGAAYFVLSKPEEALPYYAELARRFPDAPRYVGAQVIYERPL